MNKTKSPHISSISPHSLYNSGNTIAEFRLTSANTPNGYYHCKQSKKYSKQEKKKVREILLSQKRGDIERISEIDSVANLTNTTTAHTAGPIKNLEEQAKMIEFAKSITANLKRAMRDLDQKKSQWAQCNTNSKKQQILRGYFNEIVNKDPYFGDFLKEYNKINEECNNESFNKLNIEHQNLQKEFQALKEEKNEITRKNEDLQNEKIKLEKEHTDVTTKYEQEATKLKQDLAECRKELEKTKKNLRDDFISPDKIQELTEDINGLYKENGHLRSVAKRLYDELKKSRTRENMLVKLLKGETDSQGDAESLIINQKDNGAADKPKYNATLIEVGKNKIKIPSLDFSKLAPKKPTKITVVKYKKNGSSENSASDSISQSHSVVYKDINRILLLN